MKPRLHWLVAGALLPTIGGFTVGTICRPRHCHLCGWIQAQDGEWQWHEDDPSYEPPPSVTVAAASATPKLPKDKYRPKQSLGQNFLRDGNTVAKIIRTFHEDLLMGQSQLPPIIELGPGAGALTDKLVETYGEEALECIEIDPRSVELLNERYPNLRVQHQDVLQISYPDLANRKGHPVAVIGNLPYYITSQILFALADAAHSAAVTSATVTMQWEVAQRMVSPTSTKDYGILSVVFQLYADVRLHFKIPPTVFYPQPKVDSALVGLRFLEPAQLRQRLAGVEPAHFRSIVTTAFRQRRKTLRNSLKTLAKERLGEEAASQLWDKAPPPLPPSVLQARRGGDAFAASQELPSDWASKRPEQLTPGQFVELTRMIHGEDASAPLGDKVWRKLKHGQSD